MRTLAGDPGPTSRRYSRRRVLGIAAGAAASSVLAACTGGARAAQSPGGSQAGTRAGAGTGGIAPAHQVAIPTPTPTPRPVPAAGRYEQLLLEGTDYQTPAVFIHSGVEGPRVMLLGGVHGNEPGGWIAAESITEWNLASGSVVVVPRANILATHGLVRTHSWLGDLNRLYPGQPDGPPMAQMAAAIITLARDFEAELLIDMHESWAFWNERAPGQSGTAFLGQTVTNGAGAAGRPIVQLLVNDVNPLVSDREQLVFRDGTGGGNSGNTGRGTSSLSLGRFVPGLTPVLVEMGQIGQSVERRAMLHETIVRTALWRRGMI